MYFLLGNNLISFLREITRMCNQCSFKHLMRAFLVCCNVPTCHHSDGQMRNLKRSVHNFY